MMQYSSPAAADCFGRFEPMSFSGLNYTWKRFEMIDFFFFFLTGRFSYCWISKQQISPLFFSSYATQG